MATAATLQTQRLGVRDAAPRLLSWGVAALLVLGLAVGTSFLYRHERLGSPYAVMLVGGAAFGIILQRTRFCLFCIFKDFYLYRNGKPLLAVLGAIAIGSLGYLLIFESWIPDPSQDWLPPQAHIGPVGLHLVGGGLLFGLGMALSGSCISSHMYRLGEGSGVAVPSLLGAAIGFGLGFAAWNPLYVRVVQPAPVVWLPQTAGYGGAIFIQAGLLMLFAALILLRHRRTPRVMPRSIDSVPDAIGILFTEKWKPAVAAVGVGVLAFLLYFKVEPLGVTAELGRLSRLGFGAAGVAPTRLDGLDALAGCSTEATGELVTTNALFVGALVIGSLASALAGGYFKPKLPSAREAFRGLAGGVLLGFGAMISLGCSIGTFLSGTMALSISGWVFGGFMALGIWIGIKLMGKQAEQAGCSAPAAPARRATSSRGAGSVRTGEWSFAGAYGAAGTGHAPTGEWGRSGQPGVRDPAATVGAPSETAARAPVDSQSAVPDAAPSAPWIGGRADAGVVSPAQLAALPGVQIVETGRSEEEFEAGHVPGARHLPWSAIWRTINGVEGMLPAPAQVAGDIRRIGLDPSRPVVVYDDHGGARAGRLLFVLDMLGFRAQALLDGGLRAWVRMDAPLQQGKPAARSFESNAIIEPPDRWALVIGADELADRLDAVDILDTRTPAEFEGTDVRARRGGRIPGSVNIDWRHNIDADTQQLRSPDELRALYDPYLTSRRPLVLMCQSGRRSCQTWYVLKLLGRTEDVYLYDGSWAEWGNRDDLPLVSTNVLINGA